MACTGGVAAANGALLEVALKDITARECIVAENAHVRTITGVCIECQLVTRSGSRQTYVAACGASSASRGGRFWCSWDKEICHPHPSEGSAHP